MGGISGTAQAFSSKSLTTPAGKNASPKPNSVFISIHRSTDPGNSGRPILLQYRVEVHGEKPQKEDVLFREIKNTTFSMDSLPLPAGRVEVTLQRQMGSIVGITYNPFYPSSIPGASSLLEETVKSLLMKDLKAMHAEEGGRGEFKQIETWKPYKFF